MSIIPMIGQAIICMMIIIASEEQIVESGFTVVALGHN